MSKKKGRGKLLAGLAIGAGLGMLFAPKTGKETRKDLKEKMDDLIDKAKKADKKEIKENIEKKIDEIKAEIKDLDKEKVLKIAKEKSKEIKAKAEDLVAYAKEKGTPMLESAAVSVREKAVDVTKEVLKKLEKDDKKEVKKVK